MTLFVHAYSAYAVYDRDKAPWRTDDYDINKFVKALKGKPFNGYSTIEGRDGRWYRITEDNSLPAYEIFAAWAVERLRKLNLGPVTLVPVPSSGCITYEDQTCPRKMAHAIQNQMPESASIGPWLKFHKSQPTSHQGGSRNQSDVKEALRCSEAFQAGHIVLIDDVKTTGAHLRACADMLRQNGGYVETALVAAKTVWSPVDDPFTIEPEDIEA